ncbi:hypothetical protein HETIRDRAFT_168663 [Heterobasidion irregulare TC 32-1]|uniref:Uncharacterized protein n=1 Tax=Heterobasidion irregulare (strain TC 32-1) TaxID=747525 RepID=W4KH60_HETIT|nr:uncharacterized protein HETIRDRAFT_168663 [Heterobasidion irregulare TC 32-1]ETW85054.1 hypothetical protein HETIRDRAFT_168663 [Heterobasidion irregulare TC 32-1]
MKREMHVCTTLSRSRAHGACVLKGEFHPKRVSHRHSLSNLGDSAFADLANDVCYELLRRHPEIEPQTAEYLFDEPVSGDDGWESSSALRASRTSTSSSLPSLSLGSATQSSSTLAFLSLMSEETFPPHTRDIMKGYAIVPERDDEDDGDGLSFVSDVHPS